MDLLLQEEVDGDLQWPGLEQQQGAQGVQEGLQGSGKVGLLVRYQVCRQGVLQQLLHRNVG